MEGILGKLGLETLFDRYKRDFQCQVADQPHLLRQAYETRYQLYCVENVFKNPEQFPNGCETDEYDRRSIHSVLQFRPTGEAIGTARLILPEPGAKPSFSMAQLLDYYGPDVPVPVAQCAEVSRFGICRRARVRKDGAVDIRSAFDAKSVLRRTEPLTSLGLIQGLVRMSVINRVTHWCAAMEPQLLRMFGAMGLHFVSVGALVEHHGKRQLCYCDIKSLLLTAMAERPSFWEIITDGGKLAGAF